MKVGQNTNKGLERSDNQDDLGWFSIDGCEIFIVADGMGGEAGGRTAASMAIAIVKSIFEQGKGTIPFLLKKSIEEANRRIHQKGTSGDKKFKKMGTTIVVLAVKNGLAYLAHVGDSRIYRFRNGKLSRMTKDHSQVQQMVDDGLIKPEDAEDHPDSNIISRSIGAKSTVDVEIAPKPFQILDDDMFLLCSDGLCGLVKDDNIESILLQNKSVDETCEKLVAAALSAGGYDNVTVQLILFDNITKQVKNDSQPSDLKHPNDKESVKNSKKTKLLIAFLSIIIVFLSCTIVTFIFIGITQPPESQTKKELPTKPAAAVNDKDAEIDKTEIADPKQLTKNTDISVKSNSKAQNPIQKLEIKEGYRIYIVQEGDVLSTIAEKFKVKLEKLLELNEMDNADQLNIDRELKIQKVIEKKNEDSPQKKINNKGKISSIML